MMSFDYVTPLGVNGMVHGCQKSKVDQNHLKSYRNVFQVILATLIILPNDPLGTWIHGELQKPKLLKTP